MSNILVKLEFTKLELLRPQFNNF